MEEFKSTLEAFLNKEIKRQDLTKQLEQLLEQNPKSSTQLLSDLTNWHKAGHLPQEIYIALKFQIEQFDEINRPDATLIKQQDITNQSTLGTFTGKSTWRKLQDGDGDEEEVVLEPDVVIRDNYRLIERIGEGGMGVVWKAIDLVQEAGDSRNPYVAIKFLSQKFKQHPDGYKALVREFARYQRLNHPNIVHAYALSRMGGTVFMVMEFLSGISLKPFIRSHLNGISLKEAEPIIRGMSNALSNAHQEGIIHLDFKPDNVFYEPEQKLIKIIDFGIARLRDPSAREETRYDPGNLKAHTEPYASREMLLGLDPEPADDIYALACITYELLSGKHPFDKKTATKAEKEKLSPKQISGLTRQQNKALLRALAFQSDDRTPTVDKFLAELFPKKKKSFALIVGGSVLLLIALFVGMNMKDLLPGSEARKETQEEVKKAKEELARLKREEAAIKQAEMERKAKKAEEEAKARLNAMRAKLADKLQECKVHLDAKRFTTGEGGTALDCYQEVLKFDPNNPDAKAGLKAIEDFYMRFIMNAFYQQKKEKAEIYISRLEKVVPDSAVIDYLKRRLDPNYIAQQPINFQNGKGPGDDLEYGEKLFKENCVRCHGEKGEGKGNAFFPRIQGQHYEYMLHQFELIRDKKRVAYPGMVEVIENFTDRQMKAVVDFVSRLEVTD